MTGEKSLRDRKGRLTKRMDVLFPQESSDKCRVCNEPVVDGRWNYCSERCRKIANAVQRMFIWDEVREKVLERDDYTCQECGLSKEIQWRAYRQIQELIKERTEHLREDDEYDRWRMKRDSLSDKYDVEAPTGGFFQVDHIERVADGGHPFEESNLQTLCKHCHHTKTAEENSDGEKIGADEKRPEITLEEYTHA